MTQGTGQSGRVQIVIDGDKGRCVIATESYRAGQTVVVGDVERVVAARTNHSFQVGWNRHVDLTTPARYINHSCNPNTGIRDNERGGFDFIALRDIAPSEEITWDYETSEYQSIAVPRCLCGEAACRSVIRGFRHRRDDPAWQPTHLAGYLRHQPRGRTSTTSHATGGLLTDRSPTTPAASAEEEARTVHEPLIPEVIGLLARTGPAEVAVVDETGAVSYGVLNERANRLAHLLRHRGVGPGSVIGLSLPRGAALVTAVLGVLKADAAYLCLPVAGPSERVGHVVRAGSVDLVVTGPGDQQPDLGTQTVRTDAPELTGQPTDDPEPRATQDDLAYLVFTSGTSGGPKPVAVSHRSLLNHAHGVGERYRIDRDDRVLQFSSAGFDVFAEEVFPTLLAGARLVIPPDSVLPTAEFEQFLTRHRITLVNLPASFWAHHAPRTTHRPAISGSSSSAARPLPPVRWPRGSDTARCR